MGGNRPSPVRGGRRGCARFCGSAYSDRTVVRPVGEPQYARHAFQKVALGAFALGVTTRWPNRMRPDAERAQQPCEFAPRELARLSVVTDAAPFAPWGVSRFAVDSLVEEAVMSELVSEVGFPGLVEKAGFQGVMDDNGSVETLFWARIRWNFVFWPWQLLPLFPS
jgi:hypothetical protein